MSDPSQSGVQPAAPATATKPSASVPPGPPAGNPPPGNPSPAEAAPASTTAPTTASASTTTPTAGTAPLQKQFDVALVDPHDPNVMHWPRSRVTVTARSVADLSAAAKNPPAGGESAEQEAKRLTALVAELERDQAIAAYNQMYGLTDSAKPMLRYDVVAAADGAAPVEPPAWTRHRKNVGLV